MKHALLVGGLLIGLSDVAVAQGSEVYTRVGPNGTHFVVDACTPVFHYEATISGCAVAHVSTLEVYHNGHLKAVIQMVVAAPPPSYDFVAPIDMSNWGLRPGDSVTFNLKVVKIGLFGPILATHSIVGNVAPEAPQAIEAPDPKP